MKFNIGDEVKIIPGSTFKDGRTVPENAIGVKLYVRNIHNNSCVIGRAMTGAVLGNLAESALKFAAENEAVIHPYVVQILDDDFPIYHSPSKTSGIIRRVDSSVLYMIVDERAGFGKLQMGAGWVELAKVKKFK